jgi:structural maintenance of chromosome 1
VTISTTYVSEGRSAIIRLSMASVERSSRCDLFNKAFKHMQERIDPIYKDLTKGKAAPMGGVAYLSAEEYEVRSRAHLSLPVTDGSIRSRTMEALNIMPCLL